MLDVQYPYYVLWNAITGYQGDAFAKDVLFPWIDRNADQRRWLKGIVSIQDNAIVSATSNDLCLLYALQRVLELLLLSFQSETADTYYSCFLRDPQISLEEYGTFANALGLGIETQPNFHPFYHEIVRLEQADDPDQEIQLTRTLWACLMLGDLLISRAGVAVSAGLHRATKASAETSPLYWAYGRKHRSATDLSVGWGSNSQWRTEFRRDYRLKDGYHFNVDAKYDLGDASLPLQDVSELDREQWISLLLHRCLIHPVPKVNRADDFWPYHYNYRTSA